MTRLSKYTREAMARALVKHRFADRAAELTAESAELFNAVLDERYDDGTRKLMRQLQKREPKAFAMVDSLSLRARGMWVNIGASSVGRYDLAHWEAEVTERPVLHKDEDEPSEALAHRIADFAIQTQKFAEEIREAYRRALGTLEQFTTGKKLAAEWPEAMPVIGHLIPTEDRTLPVVQLEAINDEFGLPPSEMAEAA